MGIDRRLFLTGACCAGAGFATGMMLPGGTEAVTPPPGAGAPGFARERFLSHWNCTQAVLEALAPQAGLAPGEITRLTTPFAAGMWNGMTCGAVTGAVMAIGMRFGRTSDGDSSATEKTKMIMRRYMAAVKKEFGALNCSELLGTDMATEEGMKLAAAQGLFESRCPALVETAVREALKEMA